MRSRTNVRILIKVLLDTHLLCSKIQQWISRKFGKSNFFGEDGWSRVEEFIVDQPSLSQLNVETQDLCFLSLLSNFTVCKEAYGRRRAEAGKTDSLVTQFRKSIASMCLFCKDSTVWELIFWGGPQLYWTFGRQFEMLRTRGTVEAWKKELPKTEN